jgi:hypothetical protein
MPEERLAAAELEIRVLHPAGAEILVREIERVLQDRQSGHQQRWQGRHARPIAIDLTAPGLDGLPRHRLRQPHELMVHVNDLVEA